MSKQRMEAFSDGVIAIIITIMVLELQPPAETSFSALQALAPKFVSYLLSFTFLGIYWNNHHHLLQAVSKVNGQILWANLHLLFWLSLVPFATAWMGDSNFTGQPVALYGMVQWLAALAYFFLTQALFALHGRESIVAIALGRRIKEIFSLGMYTLAIILAFVEPRISFGLYILVALLWVIPDSRIERLLTR
jgi:uncharacterized membrane protein